MLYPIELLGLMTSIGPEAPRRTACMLTARVNFVMSSVGFLSVGPCPRQHVAFHSTITGALHPSCKMHSPKMPSLQIATPQSFCKYLTS